MTFVHIDDPYDLSAVAEETRSERDQNNSQTLESSSSPSRTFSFGNAPTVQSPLQVARPQGRLLDSSGLHFGVRPIHGRSPVDPVNEHLLTFRLLRHFKDGPGNW